MSVLGWVFLAAGAYAAGVEKMLVTGLVLNYVAGGILVAQWMRQRR